MLVQCGYMGITMRDLASKVGVAPATLYNLYGSKDELIIAAVDDLLVELGQRAVGAAADGQGIDAILTMTQLTADQVKATPRYAEAMTRALFHIEQDDPLVEVLFSRGYPYHVHHLGIARSAGHIRPEVNIEVVAKHIVGNGWGQVLLWMMGMFSLAESAQEQMRTQLMVLISVTQGEARIKLEERLQGMGWSGLGDASAEKSGGT